MSNEVLALVVVCVVLACALGATVFVIRRRGLSEAEVQVRLAAVREQIAMRMAELRDLSEAVAQADSQAVLSEVGFVRRGFTYEDPDAYQRAIEEIEDEVAAMVRADIATHCSISWSIEGSERKGEAMIKKLRRLALRTFNADADAAISNVKWNNFSTMEARILKSEETIEKSLVQWGITVSNAYRDLKMKELKLTFEQAELRKRVQEEQRELREQQRDEERARRDAEAAEREAAREEKNALVALEKARQNLLDAHETDLARQQERINELEARVAEAEQKRQRALSMAQQTRRGHVYIISNIGSFGPTVLKIGMTRRLDPMDRIWELSDASVPFDFDVHGLIVTDDAPGLEALLHERFAGKRVNLVNLRKEFFEVSISELQDVVRGLGHEVRLTLAAEAREHHQTLAIRQADGIPSSG